MHIHYILFPQSHSAHCNIPLKSCKLHTIYTFLIMQTHIHPFSPYNCPVSIFFTYWVIIFNLLHAIYYAYFFLLLFSRLKRNRNLPFFYFAHFLFCPPSWNRVQQLSPIIRRQHFTQQTDRHLSNFLKHRSEHSRWCWRALFANSHMLSHYHNNMQTCNNEGKMRI